MDGWMPARMTQRTMTSVQHETCQSEMKAGRQDALGLQSDTHTPIAIAAASRLIRARYRPKA